MINGDICPVCGIGKVIKETVTENFEYKGYSCPVNNYVIFTCSNCNESIVDEETIKRVEKIIRDFHIDVNKKLSPVGHICFETNDTNGWTLRKYPISLCSLCYTKHTGIDLNRDQFNKFNFYFKK